MNTTSATQPLRVCFADAASNAIDVEFDRPLSLRAGTTHFYANSGYLWQAGDTDQLAAILDALVGRKPEPRQKSFTGGFTGPEDQAAEAAYVMPNSGVWQVGVKVLALSITRSLAMPPEEICQRIRDALAEASIEFVEVDPCGQPLKDTTDTDTDSLTESKG